MKKYILIIIFSIISLNVKSAIHVILVWDGYNQFMPSSLNIELGDTIHFLPLDPPLMVHTITSSNIPIGANSFDQIWQAPADTFFQYIPQVAGFYEYVCTPHISFGMIGSFNVINTGTYVLENNLPKKIIRKINLSGSNTKNEFNRAFFMIYDDGTVEKKLLVK
tara:strand:- start:76 stop:567 length:492 start_codon:yes stop_codon:yes gene_type:complete